MSQRAEDDSPRPSSERSPLQDLVDACTSSLHEQLPPPKEDPEDPEELLAVPYLLQEWAAIAIAANPPAWGRLHARAAAGPFKSALQRLQSLADDAQKLLKTACGQRRLSWQHRRRRRRCDSSSSSTWPPSSPTLEGCDALLGVPAGTLASKGFELLNAPQAATFDRSLVSLLLSAAESLKLLGQWGRRPMAAFHPNSKAIVAQRRLPRVPVCRRAAAGAAAAEPARCTASPRAARDWVNAASRASTTRWPAAPAAARLETGTRGRAVLGDTEGLSTGANVDGRKLEHAAGSGEGCVVTNRNNVQVGSIGSRLLERAFQQAQLCDLLSRQLAEIREWVLAALPDRVRGVRLDEHGSPVSTRKVVLVPAPAGHGWAQMGVQPPAAGQPAAQAAPPADADSSLPALPRDGMEVSGSLEPNITREELLRSISKYQPCRDGPPPTRSVGINRLKEESTELLTDAQFFSEAGFHNPLASAKASKAGQTIRLKPDRRALAAAEAEFAERRGNKHTPTNAAEDDLAAAEEQQQREQAADPEEISRGRQPGRPAAPSQGQMGG
ncbi:hypothetical protein ABPG77_001860 [Micractinium sp. CCAP 211/92]